MSGLQSSSCGQFRESIEELRSRLGLFSFQGNSHPADSTHRGGLSPQIGVRPGGIVEWLVAREGAGAVTLALQMMAQSMGAGVWAVVDFAREFYVPAWPGWGISPDKILVIRPATLQETCWAIEQCLRCPGVSATWAWVDQRFPPRVHRRWQLAAEMGGGVGLFFRPDRPGGNPSGPTYVCWSRRWREARGTPDGYLSKCCIAGAASEATPRCGRSTMPRVLCVWFPRWPIQRLRSAAARA